MTRQLLMRVDDLVGHPEKRRPVSGRVPASLRLGETRVEEAILVEGMVVGTVDGVQAELALNATADLVCVRCLTQWVEVIEVSASQHYSKIPDEDGYAIVGGQIDIAGPVRDEMALALPAAPTCRPECLGLCPICGTDLNTDPCDGHGDDSDSPFASLKDLFED